MIGLNEGQIEQLINKAQEYHQVKKEAIAKTKTRLIKSGEKKKHFKYRGANHFYINYIFILQVLANLVLTNMPKPYYFV
ncbi:MAG: hypothetical protein AB4426_34470 [Xenococcaceae cyanobacterium]